MKVLLNGYNHFVTIIFGVTTFLLVLIVCSIVIIRSSFFISISEKIKQYSILSSIGTTKKQIRKIANKENLIISSVGIIIGIILSILISYLLILILKDITYKNSFLTNVEITYALDLWIIILGVLISYLTMFFASKSSLQKIDDVSPIMTLKNTASINIDVDNMKISKITKKIFGISGVISKKNIKSNKKRYNSILWTLIISITLIIGITSTLIYANIVTNEIGADAKYNVIVKFGIATSTKKAEAWKEQIDTLKNISKNEYVKKYSLYRSKLVGIDLKKYVLDEYLRVYNQIPKMVNNKQGALAYSVRAVGNEEYNRFLNDIGMDYDKCKDGIIISGINSKLGIYDNERKEPIKKFILNINVGDSLYKDVIDGEEYDLKVVAITDKIPMGFENENGMFGVFIMSDELFDKLYSEFSLIGLYVDAADSSKFSSEIENEYPGITLIDKSEERERDNIRNIIIFGILYSITAIIIVISILNIYNIIYSSTMIRKREFMELHSIGMTQKQFKKMINLESFMYSIEAIIFGILFGLGINFGVLKFIRSMNPYEEISMKIPFKTIIITIIAFSLLVNFIEKRCIKNISKSNIIDSIKDENI